MSGQICEICLKSCASCWKAIMKKENIITLTIGALQISACKRCSKEVVKELKVFNVLTDALGLDRELFTMGSNRSSTPPAAGGNEAFASKFGI